MQPIEDKKETVTFRGVSRDEEGRKRVEKVEVSDTKDMETLKYVEKKMIDKGVHQKDRRPVDGRPLDRVPKSGHGGKYTWEGPVANEVEEAPAVLDENDPNYVDEEAERRVMRGEDSAVAGLVVGEVEVPKLAEEGVARMDINPKLQANV